MRCRGALYSQLMIDSGFRSSVFVLFVQNRPPKATEVRDEIYGIECITEPFFNVFNQVESDNNDKLSEIAAAQLDVFN